MGSKASKWVVWVAPVLALVVVAGALLYATRRKGPVEPEMPPPETVEPEKVDPWKQAALKAEEDRGEPTGRQAIIAIPAQLKHYSDRRRFLGIQVAEWRKHQFETPHDFAELVALIRRGELVEVPPLGESYILYGVGLSASDEPFTHYDKKANRSVRLYADEAELRQEYEQLADSLKQTRETIDGIRKEAAALPKKERERRKALQSQVAEQEKLLSAVNERKVLLDSFYAEPKRRRQLAEEYEALSTLARDFGGHAYDLQDAASRKQFKMRLLSFVRPAALSVIEEVARSYREKFDRPLPVTSLVRTDEYQRRLGEVNPNATQIDVPPHTTGLAFDIYYRYMTAAEQEFVMAELARLQDEGRVEALRELRDHFHVFAFAEGAPPDEALIQKSLGRTQAAPAEKKVAEKKAADKKPPAGKASERRAQAPKRSGGKGRRG